jgi:hypothetical protein
MHNSGSGVFTLGVELFHFWYNSASGEIFGPFSHMWAVGDPRHKTDPGEDVSRLV